jgi:SEC-C motif-containing protein
MYHLGHEVPKTPEALMRSRYSAYALANIDYIKKTMKGKPLAKFNESEAKAWAMTVKWLKLKIIKVSDTSPEQGFVEFIAKFIDHGQHLALHENSEFQLIDGQWFYVDGTDMGKK